MISESFSEGDSVIHRLNPKIKIVFAAVFSIVVAVSGNFITLTTALGASALMVAAARLNTVEVLKRLSVLLGFIALIWLVMPFTFEGPALFCIGPLCPTRPGILLSAQISLKSFAILTAFMALVATMTIATLGHALSHMGLPDKLVLLFLITYRYIFVIEQEHQRLLRAMRIRGFKPGTNLHTYQSYAYLIGMLFVRSSIRGERVYKAMKCRGFSGKFHTVRSFSADKSNLIFSFIMTAVIVFLIGCELWKNMN
jgi:cobalt/nickel transport system permease protein